jgi:hypothetical protein
MITMTSTQKRVIICVALLSGTAFTLPARTIHISVSGSTINFTDDGDSQQGEIVVGGGEVVNWKCDGSCKVITINFGGSPCTGGNDPANGKLVSCSIRDYSSHPVLYKYTIHVDNATPVDPHVIVDNQVRQPKRTKPKKTH